MSRCAAAYDAAGCVSSREPANSTRWPRGSDLQCSLKAASVQLVVGCRFSLRNASCLHRSTLIMARKRDLETKDARVIHVISEREAVAGLLHFQLGLSVSDNCTARIRSRRCSRNCFSTWNETANVVATTQRTSKSHEKEKCPRNLLSTALGSSQRLSPTLNQ